MVKQQCRHGKSLQSCPTLCDPMDCSPPGSSVHGILQTRILEWLAIAYSKTAINLNITTFFFLLVGFPGGASGKESACQCRRLKRCRFILGSWKSPGGGNGNPLQYSCLEKFHGQRSLAGLQSMGSHRVGHDGEHMLRLLLVSLYWNITWPVCLIITLVKHKTWIN